MMKDLNSLLEDVEVWAIKNNVSIYYGSISEENIISIMLNEKEHDIEGFLNTLESKEVDYIVLDSIISDSSIDFDKQEEDIKDMLVDGVQGELKSLFKQYKENNGKPYTIRIVAGLESGVHLDLIIKNDFFYLQKKIEFLLQEYSSYFDTSKVYKVPEFCLSSKEIRSKAKFLCKDERFQRARSEKQRFVIAEEVFEGKEIDDKTLSEICLYAGTYFEIDVKPVQVKRNRSSVQRLKKQGMKKSEIANELDMSSYMVDKYF